MPIMRRLPHRLGIIVPSRDRMGHALPPHRRGAVRRAVLNWFSRAFQGTTEERSRLRGRWGVGSGVTIEEVEEVWAYCTAADFRRHKPGLVGLAEWIAAEADQEAVALLVDGGMELVAERETR